MDFGRAYDNRLMTPSDAVEMISSGDWVDYGCFLATPITLDRELAKRVGKVEDVKIRALGFPGLAAVAKADPEGKSFSYNSWHFTGADRKLHDQKCCNYIPLLYHEGPGYYEKNDINTDVMLLRTTPMDSKGFFNFGVSNSFTRAQIAAARKVIVEVNENMPYCYGGNEEQIHISEVDGVVESDHEELFSMADPVISDVDEQIAELVVSQIENGSCLQLGIGAMPNAIGKLISNSNLRDLGVHTEMLCDSYVDIYESGCISNRNKRQDYGKFVYTFALGSKKLYDFLDCNPSCSSYPVNYTNHLNNIAANDKAIAINNALEIDLFGQVSSESCGTRHISGTGGQLDYTYGCYHSRGGKAFICLASSVVDKEGNRKSRIRPFLEPGTITTLPRVMVNYVVTEYGMVNLKGKSTWERAKALISIAHPDFREELLEHAKRMNIKM
ncbi:acetyl-CoA hydrolase/transferase family protein [Desulforhopalus singaporensis]|uniref:Probable butyrate:acetyl-CoA coenzyme A-transferase n=1 Tax=Desulforhopalus singaporensis TaxID=91360 RepID=A0A1H0Q6J4_9BACT|nr:acetyl-CoA hydrolase/transferase C-terminal domain-containing protein [Desulforhopalus singaporensis]SDP12249.1 butyryl-CoA:acetate CoA-transferase [Desulforhopalus singaporensis]